MSSWRRHLCGSCFVCSVWFCFVFAGALIKVLFSFKKKKKIDEEIGSASSLFQAFKFVALTTFDPSLFHLIRGVDPKFCLMISKFQVLRFHFNFFLKYADIVLPVVVSVI